MSEQLLEDLLPKADWSVYRLVRMVANRTAELSEGKKSLIAHSKTDKIVSIALKEVAEGKIVYKGVAEKFAPVKEEIVEETEV